MSLAKISVIPFDEPKKNKIYVQTPADMHPDKNDSECDSEDTNQREQWGGNAEFLLACLGNAVGLGN